VWFSGQKVSFNRDGSISLRFPVADFGEIRKEVLKYGASVQVVSPQELREGIKVEIQRMAKLYG